MSKYSPTAARDLLEKEKDGITLEEYLVSAMGEALLEFTGDDDLAVVALADDLVPGVLEDLAGLDLNRYEVEPPHTAEDSLTFLDREAVGLLEAADEEIHGVSTLSMVDTPDLPDHVQDAVSMIQTAIKLIRMEAGLHGARNKTTYSTGAPTSEVRQEPGREPQDDGTTRLVMHDVHYGLYPDGHHNHPAFR
ncbi:hypothetical protein [Corynebacterium gallinarum]|uniref:Uncharacterized protein n=1 Tax=Corynebacterium gallinarum TaxID=2762214 RepID=A0A8I0HNI8_9CORY|nr:hypothetical protein [Corynebacterium gallinarum]MBD8029212.1 hypothetical protein [Corynebacterium gallinarum]